MRDAIDVLRDPSCRDDLILYDENGRESRFAQIAYIPFDGREYAILRPLFDVAELEQDEALLFTVEYCDGQATLVKTPDEEIADAVFAEYHRLYQKQAAFSEAERLLQAVQKEHAEFMANFSVLPALAREMDDFVKKHLRCIPTTSGGRSFLASGIEEYRDTVLERAMELVENRSMIRSLGHYDLALERLLLALAAV